MTAQLRVLLVQPSAEAAEQLLLTLRNGGYEAAWTRVETANALAGALDAGSWDIVLASNVSPSFDVAAELRIVRGRDPDVPVIVVPGVDKVESAVAAMRAGACDYLVEAVPARLLATVARRAGAASARTERRAETLFHARLLDAVDQAVIATDLDGIIHYWSRSAERLYGWLASEVVGTCIVDVGMTDIGFDEGLRVISVLREGKRSLQERTMRRRDGRTFPALLMRSPIFDEAGSLVGVIGVSSDNTEKMDLEADIRIREEQLRTIAANAPIVIYAADQDGMMTLCVGGGLRHSGEQANAYVGHPIRAVFAGTPNILDLIGQAYAGQVVTAMTQLHGRTFEARWWPTRDAAGAIVGITGLAVDLTDRVRAEAEQARLAAIITSSQDAIIGTTLDGIIESWNASATRLYGYTPEEVIGRSILLLAPPGLSHEAPGVLDALRDGGGTSQFVTVRLHKDGHPIDVAITLSPIIDGTGATIGAASITRDIGESKRALRDADLARAAADELARIRNEHAAEVEAMTQATIALAGALDPAELYLRLLEHVARVVRCDLANVMLYQDGWAVVAASWGDERLIVGERLFPLDGPDRLWAPDPQAGPCYLPDTAEEPSWKDVPPRVGPRRIRSLISVPLLIDGTLLGSFDVGSVMAAAYSPRQIQLVAIFGERVTQALRNARLYAAERERARIAEEMAAMRSDFVAAVSHELRTPLTAMLGYAELLQARWPHLSDAQRLDQIGRIVTSANRQHRLVADLLLLSQIGDGFLSVRPRPVLLSELVHDAAQEVRAAYRGQRVQVEGPEALGVRADPDRLLQVVGNLLDNAAKYSPEGSPIAVTWGAEGGWGTISVRDRGPGIPAAHRAVLFTRFGRVPGSRIRSGHVGTGLGLYLGRQLAAIMDGELELESTGPEGSTFTLRLPLLEATPGSEEGPAHTRSSRVGDLGVQAAMQAAYPSDHQDQG